LLLGGDIPSVAVGLVRLGAAALLSLAILLLLFLGIRGVWLGILLWPAVVLHAFLTVLLARIWASQMAEEQ